MKSASQMSLEIRRKKKAMQDNPGVVDLSGIPMDKQDEDLMEANSMTKDLGLDDNTPKEHSEPSELDEHDTAPELSAPEPELDDMKAKRRARISKMMGL